MKTIRPRTRTPGRIWAFVIGTFGLIWLIVAVMLFVLDIDPLWAPSVALAIAGATIKKWTMWVPGYHARVLQDDFLGEAEKRVIFGGLHPVGPWESIVLLHEGQTDLDLRAEVSEVRGEDPKDKETYATADGLVEVKYVYLIGPNVSGPDAADNILLWSSRTLDAIKKSGRALFTQSLSDFFTPQETEVVLRLGKAEINRQAFLQGQLTKFERNTGSTVEVDLEDVDRDPALQAAKDTVAKAKSQAEAIRELMDLGMKVEVATQFYKSANFENVTEATWNIKGLENLRNATVLGGNMPGTGGGGKKGSKK